MHLTTTMILICTHVKHNHTPFETGVLKTALLWFTYRCTRLLLKGASMAYIYTYVHEYGIRVRKNKWESNDVAHKRRRIFMILTIDF